MEKSFVDFKRGDCDKVPNNPEAELELCSFYIEVVKRMHKRYKLIFEVIRNSLSNIRSYKNPEIEVHETVSFNESADRFAYIYAYSFIHSAVIVDRFLHLLKSNPSMLEKMASMTKLRLCILGSGPGFEAACFCQILNILRRQSDVKCPPLLLNITLIDICNGWETDAELIISLARNKMCASSDIEINFQFIEADMTAEFSESVKTALKKSHIVSMCKFLSDVNDSSYSKLEIHQMMKRIIDCMSYKACLFFLDNAGGSVFKKVDKMIDELPQTSRIYETAPYNCHKLNIDTVEIASRSLKGIFRYLKCTAQTTISCSAWLKIRHVINANELSLAIGTMSEDNSVENLEPHKLKMRGRKVKIKKICQSKRKHVK